MEISVTTFMMNISMNSIAMKEIEFTVKFDWQVYSCFVQDTEIIEKSIT